LDNLEMFNPAFNPNLGDCAKTVAPVAKIKTTKLIFFID